MSRLQGLKELHVPGQVTLPTGHISPLVVTAAEDYHSVAAHEWPNVVQSWKAEDVQQVLAKHGGLLLRGLPIRSAEEFSKFLHAFGWQPHSEVGNPVKRVVHAPNVANANEGPPSLYIPAHTEFGISSIFPSNICFWARVAPEEGAGGETPINDGSWLLQRLKAEAPEFVSELQKKGVRYTIYHPASQLSNDANGNGVLAAWGSEVLPGDTEKTIRSKVEREIQKVSPSTTWQWEKDGGLYTFQRVPAFRVHPVTGLSAVFGNITSYYGGAKMRGTLEPPYFDATGFYKPPPLYGDDSPIPLKYLELLLSIVEEIRATVPWEQNDIFIIDNIGTQHSRLPWRTGSRSILASLWDSGLEKRAIVPQTV